MSPADGSSDGPAAGSAPADLRIAGAPITWGVSEVPGWGVQLPVERVLREMADLGLTATEFGPEGFLPLAPAERSAVLRAHGMSAVGGFVPVVLHREDHDPLPALRTELAAFTAAGAGVLVLSADTGLTGYDAAPPELTAAEWSRLLTALGRIRDAAADVGVTAVLHPHVGTLVETADQVQHVVDGSDVGFCLDSGHLLIGGTDPVEFARRHAARVHHAHLKDVDLATAARVRAGELGYHEAVRQGLYRPLGRGDVDVRSLVGSLLAAGYDGWFVLEQDTVLDAVPAEGAGPVADAGASAAFLREVAAGVAAPGGAR